MNTHLFSYGKMKPHSTPTKFFPDGRSSIRPCYKSLVPVTRVPFQLAGLGPGHYYPDLSGFVLERGILLAFRRVVLGTEAGYTTK